MEDNAADSNSQEINTGEEETICDMPLLNYTVSVPPNDKQESRIVQSSRFLCCVGRLFFELFHCFLVGLLEYSFICFVYERSSAGPWVQRNV